MNLTAVCIVNWLEVKHLDHDYLRYIEKMDQAILEDVMRHYGQDVWNFSYFLTKNRALADDITQDTFIDRLFFR